MFLTMVGFLYKQQKKRGAGVQTGGVTGGHFGGEIGRTNTKECLNEGITKQK
jgi:hypothetical protein